MDRLLFHLGWDGGQPAPLLRVGAGGLESWWLHRHHPLQAEAGVGVGGAETPTPASTHGGCSAPDWLATCPRRSRYPSFGGIQAGAFVADLGDLNAVEAAR